ncbi:M10 family metallopeptidase C-terminal domain-containing protein [Azotobacter chroococcum]|uniref:M10 family metallopeptidase C-terminal domain-containing protein n=1 Tax=Azotobacter chroococcum TaxID=353 RepID=UPI0013F17DD2|nr:M10 family metallopeptidase C-terminal domain-containing protein [Azotobacter chroococcum]
MELSYSFLSFENSYYVTSYSDNNEYQNVFELTANQQVAATKALGAWAAVANIKFALTFDSFSNTGDLRFGGYADMPEDSFAFAYLPGDAPRSGDIWIGPGISDNPTAGTLNYRTLLHEIGHAIGLKHPFESPSVLPEAYDDARYTVMSYNHLTYSFKPTTPMLFDIAAIQYLYGANMQWHTGNDVYQWGASQQIFETIWDAGGVDTLSAANRTQAVSLNLNPGTFSSIGAVANMAIAFGAQIENATGSAYADTLTGNALANVLNGGAGADRLIGGNGSDIYYVDNAGDVVSETNAVVGVGGTDTVYSSLATYSLGANLENLRLLAGGAASGTGNALNNQIFAGAGNNGLNGGAGSDTVSYAYAGRAVIASLATTAAQATGGSGSDTLLNFENLTGSAYNDRLTGNALVNVINGGGGADAMIGGNGSDIYYVDNAGDVVSETNAVVGVGGTDTVYSSLATYSLGANLESLRLLAGGAASGTGNALNNQIFAGAGNNGLNGGAGSDTASYAYAGRAVIASLATTVAQATGGSGRDTLLNFENLTGSNYNDTLTGSAVANTLNGGAGNDLLIGGLGVDRLNGGTGADRFDFNALTEMGLAALRDVIGDFKTSEGDKLDLSTLDGNAATAANEAFSFIGSAAFASNVTGQLRFAGNVLYGSTDADTAAEFEIQLAGVTTLSVADLIA